MSLPYYRFFPGDYMRDTMHLGWLEDCAYRRLLDLCYIRGKPIANDRAYIMRAIRANEPEQQQAADNVLSEFFDLRTDGWHQKKCDAELAWQSNRSAQGKHAVDAREAKRQSNQAINAISGLSLDNHRIILPEPEPEPEPEKKKTNTHTRFAARAYLSARGLSEQTITDYLAIRKDKKLTPTMKAMEAIEEEAGKAGIAFSKAIEVCCANSWAGFKASWLAKAASENPDYSSVGD